jgi:hypothetical protein
MGYLMWQLWLCLLGALLLGLALGWLLRSGCKKKLAKITEEGLQRVSVLEKERDAFATKVRGVKQLKYENKSLLGRLGSMEKGANLASDVLKDNRARLDNAEDSLSEVSMLLEQRDVDIIILKNNLSSLESKEPNDNKNQQDELVDVADGVHLEYEQKNAEVMSKLTLKDKENEVLGGEIDDLTEKLIEADKQLHDDGEKIAKLTDLYEKHVEDARVFKSHIMRSGSELREQLKNKNTQYESLEKDIELAKEEAQQNAEKIVAMEALLTDQEKSNEVLIASEQQLQMALSTAEEKGAQYEKVVAEHKDDVEKLNNALKVGSEKEQENVSEIDIMQGLLVAHEKGSDDSFVAETKLQKKIDKTTTVNAEDQKQILAYQDELRVLREDLCSSKDREEAAIDEMNIMQGLIAAHEKGSDDSFAMETKLQKERDKIKTINIEDQKKISACQDELRLAIDDFQLSKEREQSALNEVEMIQTLLIAQEEGNQALEKTTKQLQKDVLIAEKESIKQEKRVALYKEELAFKDKEIQQSRVDISELEALEKQLGSLHLNTNSVTDNNVVDINNKSIKNQSTEQYVIEEIEGIGKGLSQRLRKIGIYTTTDLLEKCKNNATDKQIIKVVNQDEKTIQSWCYMADLLRVEDVDGKYAKVLFLAGIHSIEMLAESDVVTIKNKIKDDVNYKNDIQKMLKKKMIATWIDSANQLLR